MERTRRLALHTLFLLTALLLIGPASPALAEPELSIDNYQLVASKRVSRFEFEYTYKADVTNTGTDALDVSATLDVSAPGVTVLEDTLDFGDVANNTTVTSSDTFSVRQDRRSGYLEEDLSWDISASSPVMELDWLEQPVSVTVAQGTVEVVNIAALNNGLSLSGLTIEVTAELEPFVKVTPDFIDEFTEGDTQAFSLIVSASADTPFGLYEGTLSFHQGKNAIARPLSVFLDVTSLDEVATTQPNALIEPSADRIVKDPESGIEMVRDELIVYLNDGFGLSAAQEIAANVNGKVIGGFSHLGQYQLQVPAVSTDELFNVLLTIEAMESVSAAYGHFFGVAQQSFTPIAFPISGPPNDGPGLSFAWNNSPATCGVTSQDWSHAKLDFDLDQLAAANNGCLRAYFEPRVPEAWTITTGSNNVNILVVDSGFEKLIGSPITVGGPAPKITHQDLQHNLADVLDLTTDPLDTHGLGVAGVIGAKGDNNYGLTGVMWDATMYGCNIGINDNTSVFKPDLALIDNCVNWALQKTNNNLKIVNLSFGSPTSLEFVGPSFSFDWIRRLGAFYKDLLNKYPSVLFVAASRNDGKEVPLPNLWSALSTTVTYPASLGLEHDNLIAVAGFDWENPAKIDNSSGYGAPLQVAASYWLPRLTFNNGVTKVDELVFAGGTSFSSPFVAGVAGLMLSVNPELSAAQLKSLLIKGAVSSGKVATAKDGSTIPVLDAYESVRLSEPPAVQISVSPDVITQGEQATVSWLAKNVTSCTLAHGPYSSTTLVQTADSIQVSPAQDVEYSVECLGHLGSVQNSALLTVNAAASPWSSGDSVEATQDTNWKETLSGGVGGVVPAGERGVVLSSPSFQDGQWWWQVQFDNGLIGWVAEQYLSPSKPSAALSADRTSIAIGDSTTLTWSSEHADTCTGTGTGFETNGLIAGSNVVTPTETTNYSVVCTGAGGESDPATTEITITELPPPPPSATWSITPEDISVDESVGTVTFTVTRSDSTTAQTVYVSTVQNHGATNEGDYEGKLNEPLDFAVGEDQKDVSVTINDDNDVEGDETFGLIVQQSPTDPIDKYLTTATFTIRDRIPNQTPIEDVSFAEGDLGTVGDDQLIDGTSYSIGFIKSGTWFDPDPFPYLTDSTETITLTTYAAAPVLGFESYIFFGLSDSQCNFIQRTINRRVTELSLSEPANVIGVFGEINVPGLLAEFTEQGCTGTASDLYVRQVHVAAFFGGNMRLDAFAIGYGDGKALKYNE